MCRSADDCCGVLLGRKGPLDFKSSPGNSGTKFSEIERFFPRTRSECRTGRVRVNNGPFVRICMHNCVMGISGSWAGFCWCVALAHLQKMIKMSIPGS